MTQPSSIVILMADDDNDDYMLTQKALEESKLLSELYRVHDGEELLEFLRGQGEFAGKSKRPGVILLDLNMPRKDGREALIYVISRSWCSPPRRPRRIYINPTTLAATPL
jgi:CheY-like chemotaxis protein